MANSLIDKVLTPEGIARLLQVSSAQDSQQNTASETKADPQQHPKNDLFERIKFAFFISPIHFQLDLRAPNSKQVQTDDQAVTVMLAFKGNGWQVTDLRLPRGGLAPRTAQAAAN